MTTRGFSMIEMLTVIATSSIVLVIVSNAILTFYRGNVNTFEQAVQVDQGRKGVDSFVRDVREATYADDGTFPLVSMGTSTLTFYSDIDKDSSVERVSYYLSGTSFYRSVTEATGSPATYPATPTSVRTLSNYARNSSQGIPVFKFFTASSTQVSPGSATSSISFVTIDLVINVDTNRLPGEFTIHSSGTFRNLQ